VEEIRAYIESGILELYVLGDLSPEEKLQVEAMAQQHPAVRAELQEVEQAIELYADVHNIEPDNNLRNRVLNSLVTNLADDRNFNKPAARSAVQPEAKLASLPQRATTTAFYKYAFAASLLLLCLSVAALVTIYRQLQNKEQQLLTLRLSEQKYSRQVSLKEEQLAVFRDPSFRFVQLKGTPKAPASALTVAWSATKKKVMVDLASASLPAPDKNHQYQLWAIANGKPVDLGVFDQSVADSADMKEMKNIAAAQAFAVTLEPRGGSVNPTLDQMVVMASL
jgi:anti-sigma-K factor RskA